MTEPTDRHREIATKIVVRYIDRRANKEIVGYVAAWLATVCAEERERCAKIADKYAAEVLPVDPGGVARIIAGRIRSGA
jgi:hypothetical protein